MWYATRESVKRMLDVKDTARSDTQVDDALAGATDLVETLTRRVFYPTLTTRRFDYPDITYTWPWRLWFGRNEMISVTDLFSGNRDIPSTDFFLRRADDLDEAPFDHLELDLSKSSTFGGGPTYQRDISVTGWYGYRDTQLPAGTLAAAVADAAVTSATVDPAGSAAIGVGDLLSTGTERLTVTGRSSADTAATLTADITSAVSTSLVPVSDATKVAVGETVTLDSERMLVIDVLGSNLSVRRGWDGTASAAHTTGAHVFAPRVLTVTRGASGSTAASHPQGAAVSRLQVPALVATLCRALAVDTLLNERSGYSRVSGAGETAQEMRGIALQKLIERTQEKYRRRGRTEAA